MAEITRGGVCYDLRSSPFWFDYEDEGIRFMFSSETHLEKFYRLYSKREEWLSDSLTRRFKYVVNAEALSVFQLYRQVETRGFCIYVDGECYTTSDSVGFKTCVGVS